MSNRVFQIREQIEDMSIQDLETAIKDQNAKLEKINKEVSDLLRKRDSEEGFLKFCEVTLRAKRIGFESNISFEKSTLAEACQQVLSALKRPVEVKELVQILKAHSMPFRTEKPEASVEVVLSSNRDLFERVKPHVFKLKEAK